MAFMNQERKAEIAAELKKVMPKDWKYSLAVRHHSTIVLTITAAPVDLIALYNAKVAENHKRRGDDFTPETGYIQVNEYWLENQFEGDILATFERIKTALNKGNHDRSDIQTDYFDVGWYVDIKIGRWDKPFEVISPSSGNSVADSHLAKIEAQNDRMPEPIRNVLNAPKSDLASCWRMPTANC